MACQTDNVERHYLEALSQVEAYKVEGENLEMLNNKKETIIKFKISNKK